MDTVTLRRVDRFVGAPLCALASGIERARRRLPRRGADAAAPVVVVKLAEQGAWVVADSAIRRLTESVGRDRVYLLTFAESREIVALLDLVPSDRVLCVRTDSWRVAVADLLAALRTLRRARVGTAVDLEFFARSSALLCYLSGARRRVGFHRNGREASYRGDLLTHRLVYNQRLHVGEAYLALVAALDADPERLPALGSIGGAPVAPPRRRTPPEEARTVEALLDPLGVGPDGRGLVLLNANAGDLLPLRRWPADRYVSLAERLLDELPDAVVAFTGAPSEAAEGRRLAAAVGSERCVSLAGRTTLGELVALYDRAEVLVTNDSGPAHYAALSEVDIVTLFGPESPTVFGSLSPRNVAVWAALPCSPCVNAYNDRLTRCRDNRCMQEIGVDEVLAHVLRAYRARRDRPAVRIVRAESG